MRGGAGIEVVPASAAGRCCLSKRAAVGVVPVGVGAGGLSLSLAESREGSVTMERGDEGEIKKKKDKGIGGGGAVRAAVVKRRGEGRVGQGGEEQWASEDTRMEVNTFITRLWYTDSESC